MTGNAIKGLREELAMSSNEFAQLLGVNPSTLYRWEAEGEKEIKPDPNAARILGALAKAREKNDGESLKVALGGALLLGGGLFALFKLLEFVFSTPPETPAAQAAPAATSPGTTKGAKALPSTTDATSAQKGGARTAS